LIRTLHEGLLADGISVPLTKLCAWFGVPRRTVYYKPTKAAAKVDPRFAEPIKAMIEKEPPFGYRTVAWLLGFNKNTVQRVFQIKGWQVRKRPIGMRPRIEAVPFFRLEQFFAGMPREAPYLLYCDKGLMSRLHAELLVEQGFTRVAVYRP